MIKTFLSFCIRPSFFIMSSFSSGVEGRGGNCMVVPDCEVTIVSWPVTKLFS